MLVNHIFSPGSSVTDGRVMIWTKDGDVRLTKPSARTFLFILIIILLFVQGTNISAQNTRYAVASGDWTSTAIWSATSGGAAGASVPVNGDNVIINGAYTINNTPSLSLNSLNVSASCQLSAGTVAGIVMTIEGTMEVASGATLTIGGGTGNTRRFEITIASGAVATFNGTLYFGTGNTTIQFTNYGTLVMAPDGLITGINNTVNFLTATGTVMYIGSADGITITGTTGNIQLGGTRTYSTGANYIYNGTAAQNTGAGLTQNIPANLTIDNSSGVSLSASTVISGLLNINSGTLNMANQNLTVGSLTGPGDITNSSGTSSAVTLTTGSDNTSPDPYGGSVTDGIASSLSLVKTGTGTQTFTGTANTYSGTTTISGGELRLNPSSSPLTLSSQLVLNGGSLGTSNIASGYAVTYSSALGFNNNAGIILGTNKHSLTFPDSHLTVWSGSVLAITGWKGAPGTSGTAGRIYVGTDATGLTAGQLAAITFTESGAGAQLLSTGEIVPLSSQAVISSPDPAVAAAAIAQNTDDNLLYRFDITVSSTNATLSGLRITTAGTYSEGDISNLKAWYSDDDIFSPATDILLSTKTTSTGPGTHTFPSWTNQVISSGTTGYIFVSASLPCDALVGNTIYVNAVTTADVTFVSGNKSGTAFQGGEQAIVPATPENVTGASATSGADAQSDVSWTNPADCYDEIMIVARFGSAVTTDPAGDGTGYTANTTFGSGDPYDGGYIVYKGISSPQTITNLANGTTCYFTFFTRKEATWSSGVTTTATPVAPSVGDYRSNASGNWSTATNWQRYDGSSWVTAPSSPAVADGVITIRSGHTITVTADINVEQVVVATGAQVNINPGITWTVANGTGTDLSLSGTIINSGILTATGTVVVNTGGYYVHATTNTTLPTATWSTGSTCEVTGWTAGNLGNSFGQSFYNFIWNCSGQTSNISFAGYVSPVTGTFTLAASGSYYIRPAADVTYGSYLQTGGTYSVLGGSSSARRVNVTGDFAITGGTFQMSNANAVGTLNLGGDFSHSAGTITETSGGSGSIVFSGSAGAQTYISGGTLSNTINFTVNSGAYLQMGTGASPSVISGGSNGSFTLSGGATLGVTSPGGISSSGATGNIRVTGTRTFSSDADYIYSGSGSQETGSGLPQTTLTGDITIENGSSVTATNAIIANGMLTVNGTLIPGSPSQVISGTGTLKGTGTVEVNRTDATADFLSQYTLSGRILGDMTVKYAVATGGQVVSSLSYGSLTLANTSGTNTLDGAVTVTGLLTTTSGGTLDVDTQELTVADISNDGSIVINSTAVNVNGSMIVTGTIAQTGTVTFNRQMHTEAGYGDYHYFSSPVASNSASNSGKVNTIWGWDEETGGWPVVSYNNLVSGRGYNLDQTSESDGLITFTGGLVSQNVRIDATSPYSDVIDGSEPDYSGRTFADGTGHSGSARSLTNYGGGGWNMLGNPYTSAINAWSFIGYGRNAVNFDPNYKAVYLYDGTVGDHGAYYYIGISTGWVDATESIENLVQAGQGFFVLAMNDTSTFTFTRTMQEHGTAVPMMKSAGTSARWPGLQLKVRKGTEENHTTIVYNDEMTAGLDPGYDIGQLNAGAGIQIYTALVEDNGINFAQQALPLADCEKNTVAVGIDSGTGGEITFKADIEPLPGYNFTLEDRVTGTFTDLEAGSYTVTIPSQTYGTGRFFLHVSLATGINEPRDPELQNIRIWSSDNRIIIKGEVSSRATAEVYDLSGNRLLFTHLTDNTLNTLYLNNAHAKGVFIVRVTDSTNTTSQKVVVL